MFKIDITLSAKLEIIIIATLRGTSPHYTEILKIAIDEL